MRLLILGGTADGRRMAEMLYSRFNDEAEGPAHEAVSIVYSIAGLVRVPQVSCKVISGGFTQFGGLERYIRSNSIDALLDMTHPYAHRMSVSASEASAAAGIACWRFHRPAWVAEPGDRWIERDNWPELLAQLKERRSILFTAGQMDAESLELLVSMSANSAKTYVLRTAVTPQSPLPSNMQWIKAIGPFSEQGETELMRRFAIDALVSKNSGGDSTSAKLSVARKLGIPVYMLKRPAPVPADHLFTDLKLCENHVLDYFKRTLDTQPVSSLPRESSADHKHGTAR